MVNLRKLKNLGITVQARSVFLQGLLLMKPCQLKQKFANISSLLRQWHDTCRAQNMTPQHAALSFVLAQETIDTVLVGVNSYAEFSDLMNVTQQSIQLADTKVFSIEDPNILNPSLWELN